MFITEDVFDKVIEKGTLPTVVKFTANFLCLVNKDNIVGAVMYDYNSKWGKWLPFYDDKYAFILNHNFKAKTYGELIAECDELTNEVSGVAPNSEKQAFNNANKRFFEVFENVKSLKLQRMPNIVYELKFSKTRNAYCLYKLLYFAVTEIDNMQALFKPKGFSGTLLDITKLDTPYENKMIVESVGKIITENQFPLFNHILTWKE
ncbi:MAG: hypothetical protein LBN07_00700 [Christensenellaceae bacterium]|jgi:hypothetical protein|nr:hypothetical protein [Christensenellaceae bacterium]